QDPECPQAAGPLRRRRRAACADRRDPGRARRRRHRCALSAERREMARRLLRPLPCLRGRACEATRRRGQPSRRRDRVRGAEGQSPSRRDARTHCGDRRRFDRSGRREGDHQREARSDRQWRRHRGLRDRDRPPAVVGAVIDAEIQELATRVLEACRARKWTVATVESCTGGLVAGALTEIAGSSDVVDRGFVTYSNAAKMELIGVPAATLEAYGAVSRQTAEAMAQGALKRAPVQLTVAITGIAGPGGGSAEKPVGLVHFAAAAEGGRLIHREKRYGEIGRSAIRRAAVIEALSMLLELAA